MARLSRQLARRKSVSKSSCESKRSCFVSKSQRTKRMTARCPKIRTNLTPRSIRTVQKMDLQRKSPQQMFLKALPSSPIPKPLRILRSLETFRPKVETLHLHL